MPLSIIKANKGKIALFIKLAILATAFSYLYFKVIRLEETQASFAVEFVNFRQKLFSPYLIIAILLFPVNWLLESAKWKLLVSKIEQVNIWQSLEGVLTGLTLAFITPHSLGDYAGRVWQLTRENRATAIGPLFVGHVSQMIVTLLMGFIGGIVFFSMDVLQSNQQIISGLVLAVVLLLSLLLFFNTDKVVVWIERWKFMKPVHQYLEVMEQYHLKELSIVLGLSFLRYLVFIVQFYLVLKLFIDTHFLLLVAGIALVFLMKSVVPTFNFLSDLGIREMSAVYFLGGAGLGLAEGPVILASLLIWIINILFPTIIGLFFVWRMRIFSK